MVTIRVDEAYAFDILSIYEVKTRNCLGDKLKMSREAYTLLLSDLYKSLGRITDLVTSSEEYKNLLEANEKTFILVDKVRSETQDSIGKQIDNSNIERFICKKNLQAKFFPNIPLLETKTQL